MLFKCMDYYLYFYRDRIRSMIMWVKLPRVPSRSSHSRILHFLSCKSTKKYLFKSQSVTFNWGNNLTVLFEKKTRDFYLRKIIRRHLVYREIVFLKPVSEAHITVFRQLRCTQMSIISAISAMYYFLLQCLLKK